MVDVKLWNKQKYTRYVNVGEKNGFGKEPKPLKKEGLSQWEKSIMV